MIRRGLPLALCLIAAMPAAPAAAADPGIDQLPALAGPRFGIDSAATGHRYNIFIRLPEGYEEEPAKNYPVVYLLDGDSLFPALAPMQLFLHYDDALPEAIVVGIAYGSFDAPANRRSHDFNQGAAAFGRFLSSELVPAVEARVRADPGRRILFGQSRGGTYVLHDAYSQPDLFWARIASNPTLDHPRLDQPPAPGRRDDLRLMVASGERDRPAFRERAIPAFARWQAQGRWPWRINVTTMAGGTHAADVGRVYRWAMRALLLPEPKPAER